MKPAGRGFTLIEVMLAVAIFAFAVVGFGVALNDVLGINSEILRTAQRRQAIESVAAQFLAMSNNFAETSRWTPLPDWGSEETWTIVQQVKPVRIELPGTNNVGRALDGWWQVDLEARNDQGQPLDRIAFLLWGQR